MRPHKKVKMADIAAELGVSVVTVSNALAGRKGVSPALREKIVRTAERIGYQMKKKGGGENTSRKRAVLVLPDDASEAGAPERMTAERIRRELEEAGIAASVVNPENMMPSGAEALLFIGSRTGRAMREAEAGGCLPAVGVGFFLSDLPGDFVLADEFHNAADAAVWLLKKGCTHPAGVFPEERRPEILDRYLGFHHALCCRIFEERLRPVGSLSPERETADDLAARLDRGDGVDGIYIADAVCTGSVRRILKARGIEKIPVIVSGPIDQGKPIHTNEEDAGFFSEPYGEIGFLPADADRGAEYRDTVAVVGTETDALARKAAGLLISRIDGKRTQGGVLLVPGRIRVGGGMRCATENGSL